MNRKINSTSPSRVCRMTYTKYNFSNQISWRCLHILWKWRLLNWFYFLCSFLCLNYLLHGTFWMQQNILHKKNVIFNNILCSDVDKFPRKINKCWLFHGKRTNYFIMSVSISVCMLVSFFTVHFHTQLFILQLQCDSFFHSVVVG